MPHYNYVCYDCEKDFTVYQNISAEPLDTCPHCNGKNVKRMMGKGAGIIFKGSGFYETDYKKSSCSSASNNAQCDACSMNKK